MAEVRGVIFDWDGVVIDSSRAHEESWELLARERGVPLPEGFFMRTFGMRNQQIIPEWFGVQDAGEVQRLGDRKEELYRDILRRDGIRALPGVVELLRALKQAGIPRVVGSSTPRKNIDTVMDTAGLGGLFDAIVSAEDVTRGKPEPDVFLQAGAKIGRTPAECVVIEDAHVGIEAARRAGMRVIAVATTHPMESLQDATLVLPDLSGVGLPELLARLAA